MASPSFTLAQSYEGAGGLRLHHLDLYRLGRGADAALFAWDDYLDDAALDLRGVARGGRGGAAARRRRRAAQAPHAATVAALALRAAPALRGGCRRHDRGRHRDAGPASPTATALERTASGRRVILALETSSATRARPRSSTRSGVPLGESRPAAERAQARRLLECVDEALTAAGATLGRRRDRRLRPGARGPSPACASASRRRGPWRRPAACRWPACRASRRSPGASPPARPGRAPRPSCR